MAVGADKKLTRQVKRVKACAEALETLEELSGLHQSGLKVLLTDELVRKYSINFYNATIKGLRKKAIVENWRRPWDGEDGKFFEFMKNRIVLSAMEMVEEGNPDSKLNVNEALMKEEEEFERLAELDEYKSEYDWEDTEEMKKYECELYDRYVCENRGVFGRMKSMF